MKQRLLAPLRVTIAVLLAVFASGLAPVTTAWADTPATAGPPTTSQAETPPDTGLPQTTPSGVTPPTDDVTTPPTEDVQTQSPPAVSLPETAEAAPSSLVAAATPNTTNTTTVKKVAYCHATGSVTNPYVHLYTSVNAFYVSGHNSHPDDIVPPFSYIKHGQTISFAGTNWDTAHQVIFNNDCQIAVVPPTCVSTINQSDITAAYTKDAFHAAVYYTGSQPLCKDARITVSLNSYATEGSTWATSGTQTFVDHDSVTISAKHPSGMLKVMAPSCFYQTDLYFGATRYDGNDGAVPHYPVATIGANKIDSRNGGTACQTTQSVTPAAVVATYATCSNANSGFTVTRTEGVRYKLTVNGNTTTVQPGFTAEPAGTTVTVTAKAKNGYVIASGATASWTFTFNAVNPSDCDVCSNLPGVQTTVPDDYQQDTDGTCFQPGRGGDTQTPPTIFGGTTVTQVLNIHSTTPTATLAAAQVSSAPQLANTGASDTLLVMLLSLTVIALAVGTTVGTRQQLLSRK